MLGKAFKPKACITTDRKKTTIPTVFTVVSAVLQWLNRILTEMWPYYDKAASAMIKVKVLPLFEINGQTRSQLAYSMPAPSYLVSTESSSAFAL